MATLYKRGDTYYLNWREGGVQYRRSIGKVDRKAAEAVRAEKAAQLAGLIPPRSGATVDDVLTGYLEWSEKNRPASYKGTRAALNPLIALLDGHDAEGFDIGIVETWAGNSPNAPATIAKSIKMARAAYRRSIKHRKVADNPFARVSLPKSITSRAPPWFTRAELDELYAQPRGHLWRFMANTGTRRGEIAKAVRSDVRHGKLYIESSPTGRTKSGRWRWVPLTKAAKGALTKLGKDRLVECHPDTITDWFAEDLAAVNKARAKARRKPLKGSPQWLRHTFCTHLAQAGVSLHDIRQLAGHSSIAVTEIYAHHMPGAGKASIAKLSL